MSANKLFTCIYEISLNIFSLLFFPKVADSAIKEMGSRCISMYMILKLDETKSKLSKKDTSKKSIIFATLVFVFVIFGFYVFWQFIFIKKIFWKFSKTFWLHKLQYYDKMGWIYSSYSYNFCLWKFAFFISNHYYLLQITVTVLC